MYKRQEVGIPILRVAQHARADENSYHEIAISIGLLCKTVHNMLSLSELAGASVYNDYPLYDEELMSNINSPSDRENTTYALSYMDYLKARTVFKINCVNPSRKKWAMSFILFEAGIKEHLDPNEKMLSDGMNAIIEPNQLHSLEKDALKLWHISILSLIHI